MACRIRLALTLVLLCAFSGNAATALRFGLHYSAPWSFYNDAGELDGIEYQIVSRIFQLAGLNVEYELHGYSRLLKQFSDKKLDCASPVAIDISGAHYTEAYLPFEDVAISLQKAQLSINSVADLRGKRIVAYQQAQNVLGENFAKAVAESNYIELAERELQLELLFSNRVDVVVGERRISHYLAAKLAPEMLLNTHHLFGEKYYPAACWRPEFTSLFNQGLAQLRQNGELADILMRFNSPVAIIAN